MRFAAPNRRPANEELSPDNPASEIRRRSNSRSVSETAARYEEALQRLSESDRELIIARVELGLDYSESRSSPASHPSAPPGLRSAAPSFASPEPWVMSAKPEEAWLIALANDVCDGKRIDWEASCRPPRLASEPERWSRSFARLAAVVDAHRTLGEHAPPSAHRPNPP